MKSQLGLLLGVALVAAASGGMVGAAICSARPGYSLLYDKLDNARTVEAFSLLTEAQVPCKTIEGLIYVPKKQARSLRMQLEALLSEKLRMEVISRNIANSEVSHGPDGRPYQREQVVFKTKVERVNGESQLVRVATIETDHRAPRMIFNPGHPDAGRDGMVAMPNIDIHEEMANFLVAARTYEARLAGLKSTARTLANH